MNVFQTCRNTSDAVPLYLPQDLYLKPIARIHISVQLPHQIEAGKSISNWEIMEKLRVIIKPEEFCILKVAKTALEFIRFEAEIENKSQLFRIIAMVDGRTIKLSTFSQCVKVRASEAKSDFPNRHAWDSFFRDAKNMNEMKPGERPDTIHITNLPIKWFIPPQHANRDGMKPSQKVFQRVFEKFGHIRCVDIPICDPYRSKMKEHITGMKTFTFDQGVLFEGYVQFQDYIGFSQTMDAFRGMKLLRKDKDDAYTINIKVDFDKTKHLTDVTIRRRQIVRDRLMARDQKHTDKEKDEENKLSKEEEEKRQKELAEKDAKELRQRNREERRKARHFAKLKIKETGELKKKIVKEKRKLRKAQCKLQAIRLIEQLFDRIKAKKEKDEASVMDIQNSSTTEISKLKSIREKQVKEQQEKLEKALEGRVVLESILGGENSSSDSSSLSDSDSKHKHKKGKKKKKKKSKSHKGEKHDSKIKIESDPSTSNMDNSFLMTNPNWMGYMPPNAMYPYQPMFRPQMRGMMPPYYQYHPMMRGHNNGPRMMQEAGPSRGPYPRGRGNWQRGWRGKRGSMMPHYTPELENEYYKYFRKFLDDDRDRRSYSRSSRSRSSSRNRSRRRSDNRRRSRSRSRSSSRSRRRSRSRSRRSRSRSKRSHSRSRSRTRSRSNSKSKSRSRSRSRSRNRTKSKSRNKTRTPPRRARSRTKLRSATPKKSKDTSRSPSYQSIDSSKFISPSRLRAKRSRSKSWSLPRVPTNKRRSWSKSPSPRKK